MQRTSYHAGSKTFLLFTVFWVLGNTFSAAQAQQSASSGGRLVQTTHLMLKNATFSGTLAAIMHQAHLAIVADGVPVGNTVNIDVKGPLREVLDQVANQFDYSWRESSSGVILMNKRFKNPTEAPQAHLRELRQVTSNILTNLQTLNPDTNGVAWPDLEVALANTLTLEQQQALMRGDRLQASALSPSQLKSLTTIIGSATFGVACLRWKELLRAFEVMQRSELVLIAINGTTRSFAVHDPLSEKYFPESINIGDPAFPTKKP